jgi:hypothetical protein
MPLEVKPTCLSPTSWLWDFSKNPTYSEGSSPVVASLVSLVSQFTDAGLAVGSHVASPHARTAVWTSDPRGAGYEHLTFED